jgi:hypothetical protein
MLRSAYFTVTLAELGSAAETALKLEASAQKIAVAIRPRRPVEGIEVLMFVSWMVDEWICPMTVVVGRRCTFPCGSPSWVFKHCRNAMRPRAAVHETGPKLGERG